jgi:chorismate mutase
MSADDTVIRSLREEISDVDRAIVEGINRRLRLVARIKDYKTAQGIEFVDPEREAWMFTYQSRANRGPLSQDGLERIYRQLLDLTKRELSDPYSS